VAPHRNVFSFDAPERFVAGTVGAPGERAFFLQVRDSGTVVSVAVEKMQVQLLAERLDAMLDEILRSGRDESVPAVAPRGLEDTAALDTPVEPEFRVVALAIGWDDDAATVLIECRSSADDDDDVAELMGDDIPDDTDVLRVTLDASRARAFVDRANRLVAAGRPPCPFCSLPLDPEGHICPRANGYRR
jgi:uncharacterized repeat protein (TIGR03847 family)